MNENIVVKCRYRFLKLSEISDSTSVVSQHLGCSSRLLESRSVYIAICSESIIKTFCQSFGCLIIERLRVGLKSVEVSFRKQIRIEHKVKNIQSFTEIFSSNLIKQVISIS